MITIISGTNRSGSLTIKYARHFMELIQEMGEEVQILDLSTLHLESFAREMYDTSLMTPELKNVQERYVLNADKFAIFVPEYNGSYPGFLKLFVDGISIHEYGGNFSGKVTGLIGIATGRAGNLRGMDHLADTLAHMGAWVLPSRLPISMADQYLTDDLVTDPATIANLKKHARQLIAA